MRKFVITLLSVILLTSCNPDKPEMPSPQEIFDRLVEAELFDVQGAPYMADISAARLGEYRVNPDDAVSFIAKEAAISAFFVQLIIIEVKDGRLREVYDAMKEHQENLMDATFYPQGQKAAAASIVKARGNLVYLICDERASFIEDVILGE